MTTLRRTWPSIMCLIAEVMAVVLPLVAALVTWKVCHDLSGADELETAKERIRPARPSPATEGQPA